MYSSQARPGSASRCGYPGDIPAIKGDSLTGLAITLVSVAITGTILVSPPGSLMTSDPAGQRPNACSLLTREEVKKIMPWHPAADRQKETEQPWGTGSLCSYPSVTIFVGSYSPSKLEEARKRYPLVAVAGIGDEAFLQENGSSFAELYVKVGDRMVHVQKTIPFTESFDSVKPAVIALGKALAGKLR